MRVTILTISAIFAIFVAFVQITKFFLELNANKRKQLKEDYESALLALKHTALEDENYANMQELAEMRKYQLLIGIPFITKNCAKHLLAQTNQTASIFRYRRSVGMVEFSEIDQKFKFSYGFRTTWFRKFKKYSAFLIYLFLFIIGFAPIFFWNFIDPQGLLYANITEKYSIEGFWIILIFWIILFISSAFFFIDYSAKVHFGEKLVYKNFENNFIRNFFRSLFNRRKKPS